MKPTWSLQELAGLPLATKEKLLAILRSENCQDPESRLAEIFSILDDGGEKNECLKANCPDRHLHTL